VFPLVVVGLRDDLTAVADLLRALKTGQYSQDLQIEIERTLEDLIEALEKALEQQEQQGGQQQGQQQSGEQQNPPLVPDSAELKLLKAAQMRVNRRTTSFDTNRPKGQLEPALNKEVKNIAQRQAEVAQMTQEMIDRDPRRAYFVLRRIAANYPNTKASVKAAAEAKRLENNPKIKGQLKNPPPPPATAGKTRDWLKLARNYVSADRPDLARKQLKKIIDQYPKSDEAKEAKKILAKIDSK